MALVCHPHFIFSFNSASTHKQYEEIFRLFLTLLLIGGFALSFSSCKDSEHVSNDPNSPENIALSKESESAVALAKILSYTSELDSLPDNWASNSYTVEPTVGTVLDESTPYVRYIATNNKEGAIDHYNSIVTEKISTCTVESCVQSRGLCRRPTMHNRW